MMHGAYKVKFYTDVIASFASTFGSSIILFTIFVPSQTAIFKEIHYTATQKYYVEQTETNTEADP